MSLLFKFSCAGKDCPKEVVTDSFTVQWDPRGNVQAPCMGCGAQCFGGTDDMFLGPGALSADRSIGSL